MASIWYRFLALLREDCAMLKMSSGIHLSRELALRWLLYLALLTFTLRIFWPSFTDTSDSDFSFPPVLLENQQMLDEFDTKNKPRTAPIPNNKVDNATIDSI